jgi:hypothetical protein
VEVLQSSPWALTGANDFFPLTFMLCTGFQGTWVMLLNGMSAPDRLLWLKTAGSLLMLSLAMMALIVLWTARRLNQSWQEEPPSTRQLWWYKVFCTPQFGLDFYYRFMRRSLERNPIGWLQQRTWSARLSTWSWCAVLVSFYSLIFGAGVFGKELLTMHVVLASLLSLNMAFSSSGSFRREREMGALELLLVSPLSVRQIIRGRLRGIRDQFLPAILLLLALWLYVFIDLAGHWTGDLEAWFGFFCFFVITFLTLPLIGLYFSLRFQNFFVAAFCTLGVVFVMPWLLMVLGEAAVGFLPAILGLDSLVPWQILPLVLIPLCQIWSAVIAGNQLYRKLTNRTFAFQRGGG